jgi:hypothetical protein
MTLTAALAVVGLAAGRAVAAPVYLQDYEAPGNLDAPFNLAPDFSGTTVGVVAATDTITHVATSGAVAGSGSAQLFLEHNSAESPTAAGWQWQVRFLPNSGASNTGAGTGINPLFAADGYVGYYLKVDPAVTAIIQTAPVLEGPGGTTGEATSGILQTVIKDGQWHRYQWNMDDPAQFPGTFTTVYAGGLGNTTLEATNSFDSIALVSTNGGTATINIDQIGYDNAGQLPPAIPEPSSLALVLASVGGSLGFIRRRAA